MRDPHKPQQIIAAAIRVFAGNGYYNSRVSDVAREAGIAAGTIYLYFKTKDEILVTLFREKMTEWVALVRDAIAGEADPPSPRSSRSSCARATSSSAAPPRRRSPRTST